MIHTLSLCNTQLASEIDYILVPTLESVNICHINHFWQLFQEPLDTNIT